MCGICDAGAVDENGKFNLAAFLAALNPPPVDYFDEYRTESEADLTGNYGGTPWKVSVAKVGGGTVGKTYPAGEDWIIQAYENGELTESRHAAPPTDMTHEEALRQAAEYWFDYQG